MDGAWQELFAMLEQLAATLGQLAEISREKTAAVLRDDIIAVNDCMKREQVISLSLRSADIKRDKLLERLGLQKLPLNAMADRCPENLRPEAHRVEELVRDQYMIYRSAADVARTTLEINLHEIEKIIDSEGSGGPPPRRGMADIRA